MTHLGMSTLDLVLRCSTNQDRLIAVNAVQLAVAVVANVFLSLNMARRVRFGIAQPITIIGW